MIGPQSRLGKPSIFQTNLARGWTILLEVAFKLKTLPPFTLLRWAAERCGIIINVSFYKMGYLAKARIADLNLIFGKNLILEIK